MTAKRKKLSPEQRQKQREYQRIWYMKNKERVLKKSNAWKSGNTEHRKAWSRAYNKAYRTDPARRDHLLLRSNAWRSANRHKLRINYLKCEYGITEDKYNRMTQEQGGKCAICRLPETVTMRGKLKPLSVDHCHITGAVRGLLCAKCNHGIGQLRDDPEILDSAAKYIRSYQHKKQVAEKGAERA